LKPTKEQSEIIKAVREHDRLKIEAFAGTGKTTTLRMIARSCPQKKFLVLAFNRSIARELKEKMGWNTASMTTHSLAMRELKKADALKGNLVSEKRELLDAVSQTLGIDNYGYLSLGLDAFEAFCNSEVAWEDFDEVALAKIVNRSKELRSRFLVFREKNSYVYSETAEFVKDLYELMKKGEIPFTHSFYLKYYADEFASPSGNFDCVLLDEAQDVNPVQIKLIEKLNPRQFVLVGDRHQSIYGWRGAVNSMEMFDYPSKYLTVSFRFASDQPVELANGILSYWKREQRKLLRAEVEKRNSNKQVAYVFRRNVTLILSLIDFPERFKTVRPIEEIFGELFIAAKLVKFFKTGDREKLRGVPYYLANLAVSSSSLADFTWKLTSIDPDILLAIEVAKEYDVFALYKDLKERLSEDSPYVFLTAHTAKGLEFHTVVIADDFPSPADILLSYAALRIQQEADDPSMSEREFYRRQLKLLENPPSSLISDLIDELSSGNYAYKSLIDEVNLAYVAVTRAIEVLGFSSLTANPVLHLAKADTEEVQFQIAKALEDKRKELIRKLAAL
jgi:superfamily I DNA/RNA helicase